MGSLEGSMAENGGSTFCNGNSQPDDGLDPPLLDGESPGNQRLEKGGERKRKPGGVLPLEVGTRVMCWWRDRKYHPVKVIERRKMHCGGPNDCEYYVHYTEFNRRLDEWVKLELLDLDSVETDVDEKVEDEATSLKMTRHQKRRIDETHVELGPRGT